MLTLQRIMSEIYFYDVGHFVNKYNEIDSEIMDKSNHLEKLTHGVESYFIDNETFAHDVIGKNVARGEYSSE